MFHKRSQYPCYEQEKKPQLNVAVSQPPMQENQKMTKTMRTNRRQFLKRSTGVVAAAWGFPYIVPGSALGKDGQIAPSERINVGSIGVGLDGQRRHEAADAS